MRPSSADPDQSPRREGIERFVRVTLGCQCPDHVFRSVVLEHSGKEADDTAHLRLTIGDRLLIYVLDPGDAGVAAGVVARLARAGLTERDARGLNRFRLVIAAPRPGHATGEARQEFAGVVGQDARAHLHVIAARELPRELRVR
jgi:hypothetical protein